MILYVCSLTNAKRLLVVLDADSKPTAIVMGQEAPLMIQLLDYG